MKRFGHVARKRFGQHFLTDPAVIDAIVRAVDPQPGDAVVEIGPGLGALTRPLRQRLARLTVIELDRDLAARLRGDAALHVIESDVLKVDFSALRTSLGGRLRLVGNLPYNISTPLLFHLARFAGDVVDQHFMLQKEVVDRMVAAPDTSAYGRLSVMLQWRYAMTRLLNVPPTAFAPPPQVESAVVRMVPRLDAPDLPQLESLVRTAFSQRRKLLRHTLGAWPALQSVDVGDFDFSRRPGEVSVSEYLALAARLAPDTGSSA